MITNLIQHKGYLISLDINSNLNLYNIKDFINTNSSIPKVYSSYGIVLRQPINSIKLPLKNLNNHYNNLISFNYQNNNQIFIYDNNNILIIDLNLFTAEKSQFKIIKTIQFNKLMNNSINYNQISSIIVYQNQNQSVIMVIATKNGKLIYFDLEQIENQNILQLRQSIKIIDLHSIQRITKEMQIQSEERDLLMNNYIQIQSKEYVTIISLINGNFLCVSTNQGRLIKLNKENLTFISQFYPCSNQQKDKKNQQNLFRKQITKILHYRNSLIALYSNFIIEYNFYTNQALRILKLPVKTLDFTITQSKKSLQTRFLFVGECNSIYSTNYQFSFKNDQNNQVFIHTVNLSNRLGKCLLNVNERNYVFVGGNDNIIDVFKNESLFMVLMGNMN